MAKKIKVLNLYAGLGGNRKLWKNVEVTAVENNKEIAKKYQKLFPQDKVIIGDAHEYLLKHYQEYDFIWSSPPCPSHSRARFWGSFGENKTKIYPDMKLYQEILFLKHYFKGAWVIENVIPYYKPLVPGKKIGRHLFWSNFIISEIKSKTLFTTNESANQLARKVGIDISDIDTKEDKRVIIRNMVDYKLGLHIFDCFISRKSVQKTLLNK